MATFLSANLDTSWFTPMDNRSMVPRTRLLEVLQRNGNKKVRAVLAPNGGGKTTLLQQFYSLNPEHTAWLTLQETDVSATCFFQHLTVALNRIIPDFTGPILSRDFSDPGLPPFILFDLFYTALNGLQEPVTVIVDDVQILRNSAWHDRFIELIHRSPNLYWIIAGTSRSALLGDQGDNRDSVLLTQDQLYFNANELRVFLSKNAAHQAFNELIVKTTQGWPAGVKLAQLCLNHIAAQVCDFKQPARALFTFLLDQMIEHIDTQTSGFLTQTGFLHRFNEELCQSFVQGAPVTTSLQTLQSTRFFLEVDPEHPLCFRYSPWVRERLLMRFEALEEAQRGRLVANACRWLSDHRFHLEGVTLSTHHPQRTVQLEYYLGNLVSWLRSGNLLTLYQDRIANRNPLTQNLAQTRMAWCWLLNLSGRLQESALELHSLTGDKSIEAIIQSPENHTEANCAVAYGIILSQQKRLSKELVERLRLLTKHPEVYTSLRATLYSLLAEVELHRFHAREAQHYIDLSRETSDELSYEFNFAIAKQIEARLYYFNSDPQHALNSLRKTLGRHWQYPEGVGKSLVTIFYGYLLYRTVDREAGYQTCLAQCSTLPWLHSDTQFAAYQTLVRETIRRQQLDTARHLLTFMERVSSCSGSDRYYAQVMLEHFRLATINQDTAWAQSLAQECCLTRHIDESLEPDTTLDWISQLSWLMAGVFYYRLCGNPNESQKLVQQLLYLNIESGFSVHFLSISLLDLWLEYNSGNKHSAFIKLNDLLSKTSSKDLHLGLFDDIPGSERIIHKALVDNHITSNTHRTALLELGFGVLAH
ncbi:hypothetical protein [Ketobacter sp.]|uniref:hypothetical protein n=1 Tax=Ketobacter sp. TaxID=2083498 RepID=UPI000F1B1193|nr:hypothetical protein [Ketobacter sp.]RLT97344.1 MAG: hypothetical protein D9N14_11165 [Ketobacter sp.]